ncbi:MAG: hypothetical protein Tsb009_00330 [Planctomycetaceae bacterium]
MNAPLPAGVDFRPMSSQDVSTVLEIIRKHDEDDFEEAQETYQYGLDGQYVLTVDGWVVGATGAQPEEEADRTWWLSWTYLDPEHQGTGLGAVMLVKMIERLRNERARKLFVSTSNYVDLDRGEIYRDALEAYQRLGFEEELRHAHYYERNESQIILGLRLDPPPQNLSLPEPDQRAAVILGYDEIPETDDAYVADWEFVSDGGSTTADIERLIADVGHDGGRVIFVSAPTIATRLMGLLQSCGFVEEGRLRDYYEDGMDDIHFRYDIQ